MRGLARAIARRLAARPRRHWGLALILTAAGLIAAGPGAAQVMEVGDDGQVRVFDRPAVFDADGATPIEAPRPPTISGRPVGVSPLVAAAGASRLSPELVEAVAWRESRLRAAAVSRAGAIGEMQLMPATARALGVDPHDSRQNYQGGATYLSGLLRRYDGDLVLALAAYNAGPAAVDRWGGVPPYKETRDYVAAILDRLSQRVAPFVSTAAGR